MTGWRDWIGRSEERYDLLTPALVRRHRATLDLDPDDPAPLPGIHWALCLPDAATAALGEDGHPRRTPDGILPPIDMPRRMWAASEVAFVAPLPAGAAIVRRSTVANISEKAGASGRLAFVTLDHETEADGVVAVRERQTLVYREPAAAPRPDTAAAPSTSTAAPDPAWPHRREIVPSEALLFRFSALTFNSHRIHYDRPYAQEVEGYRGLAVHGPLSATLLLDLATTLIGAPRRFAFRALAPAYAGEPLSLAARADGDGLALAALGPDGSPRVTASAAA